MTYFPDIPLGA